MTLPLRRLALALALLLPHGASAAETPGERAALDRRLADACRRALDDWQAPGLAVAVVRGGEVIFLRGFGVRAAGREGAVTPDTVFPVASCGKAFTTALLAAQVGDGTLDWDDHVRDRLPWFHLADPLADREVRLRDLLCHRTGLASHNLLWYRSPFPPEEVVRRAGLLPPERPFRAAFQYQSTMYTAAGLAAAAAGRKPWADLVRERLLTPLDMRSTVLTTKEATALPDHAEPHRLAARPGAPRPAPALSPRYVMDTPDAAGSAHSTARDLANWLLFHLGGGKFRGRVVVPAGPLAETHAPQMVLRMPEGERALFPDTVQHSYALAWVVYDYGGREVVGHGGAVDGFRAQVSFLPGEGVGVAVLCNLDRTQLPLALSHTLLDILLERPRRDWHAHYRRVLARTAAENDERERAILAEARPGARPARGPNAYAGDYDHPAYGRVRVTLRRGGLVWSWRDFEAPLEVARGDTFVLVADVVGPARVTFTPDAAGRVAAMRVTGALLDVEFRRARP